MPDFEELPGWGDDYSLVDVDDNGNEVYADCDDEGFDDYQADPESDINDIDYEDQYAA